VPRHTFSVTGKRKKERREKREERRKKKEERRKKAGRGDRYQ
jgi:hypothetical protein